MEEIIDINQKIKVEIDETQCLFCKSWPGCQNYPRKEACKDFKARCHVVVQNGHAMLEWG